MSASVWKSPALTGPGPVARRWIRRLRSPWSLKTTRRMLFSSRDSAVRFGVGPEVGLRLRDSVRFAFGYNILGFRDRAVDSSCVILRIVGSGRTQLIGAFR